MHSLNTINKLNAATRHSEKTGLITADIKPQQLQTALEKLGVATRDRKVPEYKKW